MDFTEHFEMNRNQDLYGRYIGGIFPVRGISSGFPTVGLSKHLVSARTPYHTEHGNVWPVTEERVSKRPSFLRLDSQGQSSDSGWIYTSSSATSSSVNVQTPSLFSDMIRRFADTHGKHSLAGRYCKPESIQAVDQCLNITSAVTQLCQKENMLFPRHWNTASAASGVDLALCSLGSLQCWSNFLPVCASRDKAMPHTWDCQQPVELVSGLQLLTEEECFQDLPYDFHVTLLRSLTPAHLPFTVDLTDCVSDVKDDWHENSVNQPSVVSARSFDVVDSSFSVDTRLMRKNRQPRYNCRRRLFRNNTKRRKPSVYFTFTCSKGVGTSTARCEVVHSDSDSNKCIDSVHENECISSDSKHATPQYFSSAQNSVTDCDVNDAVWVNQCCSQPTLPSSLYNIRETHIQESSCSFASLFSVSAEELDGSDICSFVSDDSDFSGVLSSSPLHQTDDVIADMLCSTLPCFNVPFTANWVMGFGDCTPPSFDSDFEVFFDECSTMVPSEDVVCEYSMRVPEANARWNKAYAFPEDLLLETSQHHSTMVRMKTCVVIVASCVL